MSLFDLKVKFLNFHAVVLVNTFLFMHQNYFRTDIDEAKVISFLGGTDRRGTDRLTRFRNPKPYPWDGEVGVALVMLVLNLLCGGKCSSCELCAC